MKAQGQRGLEGDVDGTLRHEEKIMPSDMEAHANDLEHHGCGKHEPMIGWRLGVRRKNIRATLQELDLLIDGNPMILPVRRLQDHGRPLPNPLCHLLESSLGDIEVITIMRALVQRLRQPLMPRKLPRRGQERLERLPSPHSNQVRPGAVMHQRRDEIGDLDRRDSDGFQSMLTVSLGEITDCLPGSQKIVDDVAPDDDRRAA